MVQSIDISIVLRGRCIARKDDSINKASEMQRTNYCELASVWDSKEALSVQTSTATPKPRAAGSNPSAFDVVRHFCRTVQGETLLSKKPRISCARSSCFASSRS